MTKQHVLVIILIVGFVLAWSKFGHADSIICDDLIFTETSSIEIKPTTSDGTIFKGTIPVKQIKVFGVGARIHLHRSENDEIYFNQMTQCMSIEDKIDSVRNLKWFLQQSEQARISNWRRRR